jgi:dTDP-4-amino-4,6-dideoxygalactose transaminase
MDNYKIPLFKLNFDSKEEKAVLKTIQSKWISTGERTFEFERKFASMIGSEYSLATTNCTASLHLAMLTAGIKPGDEVLCPSLTFVATVNAIRYVGAIPVFCDIVGEDDLTISYEDILRKISKKTKAIIVMHYGGFPCNMSKIMSISRRYKIKVIEDACHAPLSEYNGKILGTYGVSSCYSFFSNKNISTGEGGMFVTNNKKYYNQAKLLRSHGMTTASYDRAKKGSLNYDVLELGYNYRLDDIRSSIGLAQLSKLNKDISQRGKIRRFYINFIKDIGDVKIPFGEFNEKSSNYIFPILVKNRDKVRDYLSKKGVQTSIHYPPVHRFKIYKEFYTKLPITDGVASKLLTLPMYSSLKVNEIKYIVKSLSEVVK